MHIVLQRTLFGFSRQYYMRQFFFGLIFPAILVMGFIQGQNASDVSWSIIPFLIVNSLIYPYSRFIYETAVGYIMGSNVLVVNAVLTLMFKIVTMILCWGLAIFVAPIGLIYLYIHNSRKAA